MDIEIKPGHPSFCVWDVFVEGEFFNQYETLCEAEEAAERIEEAHRRPPGVRLPCGCIDQCDPYAHDTAPDWDGTPDGPYYTRCPECDGKIYEDQTEPPSMHMNEQLCEKCKHATVTFGLDLCRWCWQYEHLKDQCKHWRLEDEELRREDEQKREVDEFSAQHQDWLRNQ